MSIVPNLELYTNHDLLINAEYLVDPIDKPIIKYNNNPSMLWIKKFIENSDYFSFQHVSKARITRIINMSGSKKGYTISRYPN